MTFVERHPGHSWSILVVLAGAWPAVAGASPSPLLERLLRVPEQHQVLQTSSHNKTGKNGDADMPLYKDEQGDDVILDAAGPGCVRSIWGTYFAKNAELKFYFDGEKEPRYRINEIEFFSGKHAAFPPPLASYELRGHYGQEPYAGNCFVPIPFEKSLKISISGGSRFFHVIYELYPHGQPIDGIGGPDDKAALMDSFRSRDETEATEAGLEVLNVSSEENKPGSEVVLFERKGKSGTIREIIIEADGSDALFQQTQLVMRWDGHPRDDVRGPVGMFFACANHACEVRSLPVTVQKLPDNRVRLRSLFPMPFWREARIVWQNRSAKTLGPLQAKILVSGTTAAQAQGTYFTTLYHRGETTYGRDWPLFDSPGTGWFVGVVQSMYHQHYCEGNEHFYVDGAVSPQINGTGTEDYYLGCFWPNTVYNSPFAVCAEDIQIEGGGTQDGAYAIPASYARFHLEAPIPFFRSIDARIQHGGRSDIQSDYRSLAFCYLRRQQALRETDCIKVGNAASEQAHQYAADGSEPTGLLTARPEGEYFEISERDQGRRHARGAINFTVAIDPRNNGVRLRRRLDQAGLPQAAEVYVEGQYAGRWLHGYQNEHLRWYDSDFDVHPQWTRGKTSLAIKLVVLTDAGLGPFLDFNYRVNCFEAETNPSTQPNP